MSGIRNGREVRGRARRGLALLAAGVCLAVPAAAAPPDSPYHDPALVELMSDALFRVGFDDATMKPDMQAGPRGLVRTQPSPYAEKTDPARVYGEYAPGIVGRALKAGSGMGVYDAEANIALRTRGAVALWVKPLEWRESGDENVPFFTLPGGVMGLQRQAGRMDAVARTSRGEMTAVYVKQGEGLRNGSVGVAERLENGRWHLLVANWSWPSFSLSLDGGPFRTVSVARVSEAVIDARSFYIGPRGAPPATLIDEVTVFSRPLDAAEVKLLHDALTAWHRGRAE